VKTPHAGVSWVDTPLLTRVWNDPRQGATKPGVAAQSRRVVAEHGIGLSWRRQSQRETVCLASSVDGQTRRVPKVFASTPRQSQVPAAPAKTWSVRGTAPACDRTAPEPPRCRAACQHHHICRGMI